MRIAINLAAVNSSSWRVISKGILTEMARLAPEDEFLVFMPPDVAEVVSPLLPANFEQHVTTVTHSAARRVVWEQTVLPVQLKKWRADVLFAALEFAPLASPCPVLLAVHNTSPHHDDEWINRVRRWLSARSCRVADQVLFISEFGADFCGSRLGVPENKRVVVYHGTDQTRWKHREDPGAVLRKHGIEDSPYILFVSMWYRYKHPETLLEGFARWLQQSGRSDYKLVLTGAALGEPEFFITEAELRGLVDKLGIAEQTRFLGLVPTEDIPSLYQNAAAFVMPTRIEGFGLPYIEAMASGVPVICADIEVAREVCSDAALYFPVCDAAALAEKLESLIGAPELTARMVRRGHERASLFTFEREARETLALLRGVVANRRTNRDLRVAVGAAGKK